MDAASAPAAPTPVKRRRLTPWLISAGVVIVLAVAAWFVAEQVARGILSNTVRDKLISELALPKGQPIAIDVAGAVLPQLIGGTISNATVTSHDVTLGDFTGDVVVHAAGVPVRGSGPIRKASATVSVTQPQLQKLLSNVEGFPADKLSLDAPDLAFNVDLNLLAVTVPLGVTLEPSAENGELVLTPQTLRAGGTEISAQALAQQFGPLVSSFVKHWTVCVAAYIPAGVSLSTVAVSGSNLVADFAIDGRIVSDKALQQKGTCS